MHPGQDRPTCPNRARPRAPPGPAATVSTPASGMNTAPAWPTSAITAAARPALTPTASRPSADAPLSPTEPGQACSTPAPAAHIAALRAGGLSLQGIGALSGVGYGTLARIVYGDPSRDQLPTTQVRSATARRLLQIPTETVRVTDRSRVTSGASRRRLQALAALGWPFPALAVRLGRSPGNLRRTLTTRTVTVASARTIAELYEALRDTAPPTRTPAEITAAGNTRTQARLAGWLPPLAWDDIDVDPDPRNDDDVANMHDSDAWVDEIAVERAMDGDQVSLSRLERDEAIARLTRQGASARRIAELLATSSRNVVRRRSAQRAATSVGPPKRSLATKQRPGLCRAVEPESLTPQAIQPRARHNPELAILGVISSSR